MSASTAPASTEESWSGSPTSTSRASGRTASSSRAIKVSDTMDISSTTTTSYGSRLSAWWRNRPRLLGSQPSSRCRVTADRSATRATSSGPSRLRASASASDNRAAALPVGAASAIRGGRPGWSPSMASTLATVVVLPVPGPPASTVTHCRAQTSAARRCRSSSSGAQPLAGEQAVERGGQPVVVDGGRGCGAAVDELAADRLLLPPVALQVEVPGHQPQRPPVGGVRTVGEGPAGPAASEPGGGLGPGQVGHLQALLGRLEHVTGHGGQVDADRPEAQRTDGQGQSQRDGLVGLAGDPGHRGRRVDVGQIEHARPR